MKYKEIKKQIAEGNLSQAIEFLTNEVENSQIPEKNEIILQSSRLNSILKEKRIGIVSTNESNIIINQVTDGILSLLDKLEKKYPKSIKFNAPNQSYAENLITSVSSILSKNIGLIPSQSIKDIEHLVKLYEIHKINLQTSEAAAAKWGELAPSIIIHQLNENRQKIEDIKLKINSLI